MRSLILIALTSSLLFAADPVAKEWKVDGVKRDGLLYVPAKAKESSTPVVFVFHGHTGTAKHAARTMSFHTQWPEAIIVYPQGLPTPSKLVDPDGKQSGWQSLPGDQKDRDLKFFDEMLKQLKADFKVDDKRIYSTGHSNGGAFTYLLWGQRADVFAALAPSAAVANVRLFGIKTAKPLMHLGAENDPLVKFSWQQLGIAAAKKVNDCDGDGKPWDDNKDCKQYASKTETPVVTHITKGDHSFPKEAPELIVKFFKEHAKK